MKRERGGTRDGAPTGVRYYGEFVARPRLRPIFADPSRNIARAPLPIKTRPKVLLSRAGGRKCIEDKNDLEKNWNDEYSVRVAGGESDFRSDTDAIAFRDLTYSFQRLTNLDNGAFDALAAMKLRSGASGAGSFHTSATKAPFEFGSEHKGIDAALHTWCAAQAQLIYRLTEQSKDLSRF